MANNKKKVDLIYKKKTGHQHLSEENEIYYDDDPHYIWCQESYDYDWAWYTHVYTQDGFKVCVTDNANRLRQDKIDSILGEKGSMSNPTIEEILPKSLIISK